LFSTILFVHHPAHKIHPIKEFILPVTSDDIVVLISIQVCLEGKEFIPPVASDDSKVVILAGSGFPSDIKVFHKDGVFLYVNGINESGT